MVNDTEFEAYANDGGKFLKCPRCGKRRLFQDGYCNECGCPESEAKVN